MKSNLNRFVSFCLLALAPGLLSCTQKPRESTLLVGEVGSMSGPDATFGISTHRGIQIGVDQINAQGGIGGKKIELVTLDDQGKASDAVTAMTQLITQKKVRAILGEVASSLSIAMAPIAQQYKIPMITPSSINSKVTQQGDYIFRVCFVDAFSLYNEFKELLIGIAIATQ